MPWPIEALPYPFELGFMQRALVASVVVGVFAPMIGTFVVQKKMSLIGDGIGHLAFAGVGAGLVAGVSPIWAALVPGSPGTANVWPYVPSAAPYWSMKACSAIVVGAFRCDARGASIEAGSGMPKSR